MKEILIKLALSILTDKEARAIAPDTIILVGSYDNNSAPAVVDLTPPYDDRVVYNFHCYEPLKFTHQGGILDGCNPAREAYQL